MINLVQNPITSNAGNSEWEVIYSSDYGTSFRAYHAFDNDEDSRFLFSTNTGGYIGLLKKDTIPVFLERITYRSKLSPGQSSPIFIIQIYNGTEWVNHQNVNLGSLGAQEYIIDLDVPLFVLGVRLFFSTSYGDTSDLKFFGDIYAQQYLIKENNEYKSYNGTNWFVVTINTPTVSDFTTHGLYDLNIIKNYINNNDVNIDVLMYYNSNLKTNFNMNIVSLPNKQIVTQSNDISLEDVLALNQITFIYNITNIEYVKCFVSKDQGTTWYTYYNNEWTSYELNESNLTQYGMSLNVVNNISNWDEFIDTEFLRFSFLLSKNNIGDNCQIDKLNVQVDLKGCWEGCSSNHSTYKFKYIKPTLCRIELYKPGIYKLNY